MADVGETWVSEEFSRLAQVINDYDHNLFLEMVPVADQKDLIDKSKVFRIVDDSNKKIVMYADSLSNPPEILAKLWSMDKKGGDVVARLDAHNAAVEALRLRNRLDEEEAAKDFSAFVIKNTKSRWTHNGGVYDDEFRSLGSKTTVID